MGEPADVVGPVGDGGDQVRVWHPPAPDPKLVCQQRPRQLPVLEAWTAGRRHKVVCRHTQATLSAQGRLCVVYIATQTSDWPSASTQ